MSERGDCAVVAAQLVCSTAGRRSGLRLCHGQPVGRGGDAAGKRYFHAWVETLGGVVIDQSNGLDVTMPVEAYYALGRIGSGGVARYSAEEATLLMAATGTYGPWPRSARRRARQALAG